MSTSGRSSLNAGGLSFAVRTEPDADYGPPWSQEDGWGVVTRTPSADHVGDGWFYHRDETMAKAAAEGWGLSPAVEAALARQLQRAPTPGEVLAEAVRIDRAAVAGYLRGDWHYVMVVVELLNLDGNPTGVVEARGGIDSTSEEYIARVAAELADEIVAQYPTTTQVTRGAVTHQIREKPHRVWHGECYRRIRDTLDGRGMDARKAHSVAARYAKRKGTDDQIMTAFYQENPYTEELA